MPSTIATSPGPCDSPAVVNLKVTRGSVDEGGSRGHGLGVAPARAGGHRDQRAEGEAGRERDGAAAGRPAVPGDQGQADDGPGGEGDHHRLDDRGAEIDAEHSRQLDVAESHAVRPDQRGGEQEARSPGAGGEPLRQLIGSEQPAQPEHERQAGEQGPVGHQPGAQVADRDDAEHHDERGVEERGGHIVESAVAPELSPV